MDWVIDDNDFWNTIVACSLINTTSDGKQLSFWACNIDHIMESFGDYYKTRVQTNFG